MDFLIITVIILIIIIVLVISGKIKSKRIDEGRSETQEAEKADRAGRKS